MKIKKYISLLALTSLCSATLGFGQDPVSSYDLDEVVVQGSRLGLTLKSNPQKVEVIDLKQTPAFPNESAIDLLKRMVNIDVIEYPGNSAKIGLRGFPASAHQRTYTLILIDGVPAGTNNLTMIPTEMIDRIEVVKGANSVQYGSDAMGGLVNIITKKPQLGTTGKVSVGAGSWKQMNVNGYITSRVGGNTSFNLGFSHRSVGQDYRIGSNNILSKSELTKNILDKHSYGDIMEHTKNSSDHFTMGIRSYISSDVELRGRIAYTIADGVELPGNLWHTYGMSSSDNKHLHSSLDLKWTSGANTLTVTPYFASYSDFSYKGVEPKTSDFISNKSFGKQYGLKMSDMYRWRGFTFMGGADFDVNDVKSQNFENSLKMVAPYRPDNRLMAPSAFAQIAYQYDDKFFANAGVRYTYSMFAVDANELLGTEKKSEAYSIVTPTVGLKYFIIPSLNIHASYGNAFFAPDAYQVAGKYKTSYSSYVGNPNLKPERSHTVDAGIQFVNNDYINADVTYFYTLHQNLIVEEKMEDGKTKTFVNADAGKMSGLEFNLSTNLLSLFDVYGPKLELYGNFTYMLLNNVTKGEVTKDRLYIRKATGNFGLHFSSYENRFGLRLNARYIGSRLENDWLSNQWNSETNSMETFRPIKPEDYYVGGGYEAKDKVLKHPQSLVFDLSSSFRLNSGITLGVTASNLFDENYTEKDGYNMPGRSLMGSISYTF